MLNSCCTQEDGESDEEADDGTSTGKRKARASRGDPGSKEDGDAKRRRDRTGKNAASKAKRPKPSYPYVEVEYEDEAEGVLPESMSVNW